MNGMLLAGDCVAEIDGVSVWPASACIAPSLLSLDRFDSLQVWGMSIKALVPLIKQEGGTIMCAQALSASALVIAAAGPSPFGASRLPTPEIEQISTFEPA
jgi:hypothetical protein